VYINRHRENLEVVFHCIERVRVQILAVFVALTLRKVLRLALLRYVRALVENVCHAESSEKHAGSL
jgi:hypothetical protein